MTTFKRNNKIVSREKIHNLSRAFKLLTLLSKSFFAKPRKDCLPQKRDI